MADLLTGPDGFECVTCGHEWTSEPDDGIGPIHDANGNLLVDGDTVTVIKDIKLDGKSGGVKVGTKLKGIRLVSGDHPIDGKIDGRGILIRAEFVKKA
jgi:protein PhnA